MADLYFNFPTENICLKEMKSGNQGNRKSDGEMSAFAAFGFRRNSYYNKFA